MPDETVISPEQQKAQEAKAKRIADAKALAANREGYKTNVGKTFTDTEVAAFVHSFHAEQNIRGEIADAYSISYGNPNCQMFVPCERFLAEFKPVEAKG